MVSGRYLRGGLGAVMCLGSLGAYFVTGAPHSWEDVTLHGAAIVGGLALIDGKILHEITDAIRVWRK